MLRFAFFFFRIRLKMITNIDFAYMEVAKKEKLGVNKEEFVSTQLER